MQGLLYLRPEAGPWVSSWMQQWDAGPVNSYWKSSVGQEVPLPHLIHGWWAGPQRTSPALSSGTREPAVVMCECALSHPNNSFPCVEGYQFSVSSPIVFFSPLVCLCSVFICQPKGLEWFL